MKVYLEATHLSGDKSLQRLKLNEVQYLLDRHKNIQQRRFLKELAYVIVSSDIYFSHLPAPSIASLVGRCFDFLEAKQDKISLKTLPLPNEKQELLIISAPNASYLVESLLLMQQRHCYAFTLLAHPVLSIRRCEEEIIALQSEATPGNSELFIIIKLNNLNAIALNSIQVQCRILLQQSCRVIESSSLFSAKLEYLKSFASLSKHHALLTWLQQESFIPVAYQKFRSDSRLEEDNVFFDCEGVELARCIDIFDTDDNKRLSQEVKRLLNRETDVAIHQLGIKSPLINNDALVYVGFRESNGQQWIEHAFIGLFKNIEINCAACHVTELRNKVEHAIAKIRIGQGSHGFLKLQQLFSLFPKLELFFLGDVQFDLLTQSLCRYLNHPRALKLLFLASPSPLCISLLVIIPEMFQAGILRKTVTETLVVELDAELRSQRLINYGECFSALYISLMPRRENLHIDIAGLEKLINRKCRPWLTHFRLLLDRVFGKQEGGHYWQKYRYSFSADYQSLLPPRYAIKDLLQCEKMDKQGVQGINLLMPCLGQEHFRLHFYSVNEQFLDEYIPVLENLNLRLVDQVQFNLVIGQKTIFIKSFAVIPASGVCQPLHQLKPRLLALIQAILQHRVENDELNRLLLLTGMSWQDIDVFRLYRNYCMQLDFHVTTTSFHRALLNNPDLTHSLFDYFEVRFRPDPAWNDAMLREEQGLFPIRMQLLQGMELVEDLNDDRILRTLFNLIDSTVRSNFHVRRWLDEYFIAIKINSLGVLDMPSPRPSYEIYVHAADMEGIHLRGGKIARGGIRWSDRPDDFRTEILGLMQTQMSKNALIVPAGAKGGYVVKRLHSDEDFKQAGKRAYQQLMKALLDLTDNYADERVKALPGIVSYDDPDPYLVVAADKGTAQFPDVANAIAAEYKFWLGDAFASGGSHGYNHKVMGITARGAWESVKRHFRELGRDIQSQCFTVVGVGSMDGDVFGNGMLLSRCIQLRAAISGLHIFLDPSPDPETSYHERKRLFDLPGSSWTDYSADLLSQGGGVFRRDSKDIPISEEIRQWLGIRYKTLDGETLIRYLLMASVDLLWLGGIGTYVKARDQKHEEVGDRQNDNVRVDACDLKALVIGEGANLGFTRQARIEYALAGGRINTDAVDNSAGVDTSDHEVNLKILLRELQRLGKIDNHQALFDRLSEYVAESVLANNYQQTLCLSLELYRCNEQSEAYLELAERLSMTGLLDFRVEAFPSAKTVLARDKVKLTRPELAVLMASAKRWLTQQLLELREFVATECCDYYLLNYFPPIVVEQQAGAISSHPLATAIKATYISNLLINQAGCALVAALIEGSPNQLAAMVSSYLAFDRILQGQAFRKSVYALDNQIDAETQYRMLLQFENRLSDFCLWSVANNARLKPEQQLIDDYRHYLNRFIEHGGANENQPSNISAQLLPETLIKQMQTLELIKDFPAIVALAIQTGRDIENIIYLYTEISALLSFDNVREQLKNIALQDSWERKMHKELRLDIDRAQSRLAQAVIGSDCETARLYFLDSEKQMHFQHYQRCCQELASAMHHRLMPYLVWYKALEVMIRAVMEECGDEGGQ